MPPTQELDEVFGERVDGAIDKIGGMLPIEWSLELRRTMRRLLEDAYAAGAAQSHTADSEIRRSF